MAKDRTRYPERIFYNPLAKDLFQVAIGFHQISERGGDSQTSTTALEADKFLKLCVSLLQRNFPDGPNSDRTWEEAVAAENARIYASASS